MEKFKYAHLFVLISFALFLVTSCATTENTEDSSSGNGDPRVTSTPDPTSTPNNRPPTPSPLGTPLPQPSSSPDPGATPSPGASQSPAPSPGVSPTPGVSPSPGASPTPAASPSPGATPTPGPSPTPSPTSSPSPSSTPTPAPPSVSSCCIEHGTPGCDDSSCQSLVCGDPIGDEFCCTDEWDDLCVEEALEVCPQLCFDSDCCYVHGGAGCDDQACENTVCGNDPFCCNNTWDIVCAETAVDEACTSLCAIN